VKLIRTDIVSLLDLRFKGAPQISRLPFDPSKAANRSSILDRLDESFSWLFYGKQLRDFELIDISPAFANAAGAALRINRRLGIGTYMVWRTYYGDDDVRALKAAAWNRTEEDLRPVYPVLKELSVERFYPFVAVQVDSDDIERFATSNAEEIGQILTGDLEGERPATLRTYIETDLSLRSYEKLLVRWTEALALYSRMDSDKKYEECMFRAVQVFENCVLARVSLLALAGQMDQFMRHMAFVTPAKWTRSRDLLASFSNVEETFVMYPGVQSVEADRLISGAHAQFGIDKVLAGAKAKQSELRDQLEWAKTQTLGLLALLTYLLDKIIGWENVRCWVASGFHHIF
jgi:hypothetical protein